MKTINSSPENKKFSRTIEPIINSISPHARQVRENWSIFGFEGK